MDLLPLSLSLPLPAVSRLLPPLLIPKQCFHLDFPLHKATQRINVCNTLQRRSFLTCKADRRLQRLQKSFSYPGNPDLQTSTQENQPFIRDLRTNSTARSTLNLLLKNSFPDPICCAQTFSQFPARAKTVLPLPSVVSVGQISNLFPYPPLSCH